MKTQNNNQPFDFLNNIEAISNIPRINHESIVLSSLKQFETKRLMGSLSNVTWALPEVMFDYYSICKENEYIDKNFAIQFGEEGSFLDVEDKNKNEKYINEIIESSDLSVSEEELLKHLVKFYFKFYDTE